MKKKLWLAGASLAVLLVGLPNRAHARATNACPIGDSCSSDSDCQALCRCRFIANGTGECGDL